MLQFILNNQSVSPLQPEGSTVLDFVRYHKRLTGTKIGCREGDCGACTILVGSFENDQLVYRSMTSCLMPLSNAQGKHIVTVEGINLKNLSPVQQAMVDTNGTQCGFCTLGFVMSFTGFVINAKTKSHGEAIAAIDGNICRCTGYKSIERSAKIIADALAEKPAEATTEWLVTKGFLPSYFLTIKHRLKEITRPSETNFSQNGSGKTKLVIAGGTDLVVQRPLWVKGAVIHSLFDAPSLKGIKKEGAACIVGGGTTVTEFLESPIIQEHFPQINQYIKLVSSTPIRNMATMAGNIVNASPIGDMAVFFLALDARIVLMKDDVERTIKLAHFYKGYKQTDRAQEEIITKILFVLPTPETHFNFEKVSKRTNLDIASVNTACQIKMDEEGTIESIHLSAGGVAPYPKYLFQTVAFLKGKKADAMVLNEALHIMFEEVSPISDARGSKEYKSLLLRQLVIAHFQKAFGTAAIKQILFQ